MQLGGLSDEDDDAINGGAAITNRKGLAVDPQIEPWGGNLSRSLMTHKNPRKEGLVINRVGSERKQSLDERIDEMYRKYGKQTTVVKGVSRINSRELYRQQLQQFQGGLDFKQIGAPREQWLTSPEIVKTQLQKVKMRSTSKVLCDTREVRLVQEAPAVQKPSYFSKSNNRFQRVLKIKDKIRRKNSLAISKQRKEYQPLWPYSEQKTKELPSQNCTGRKTSIRFGQSKSKREVGGTQVLQVVGVYSNALQYIMQREKQVVSMKGVGNTYKMLQTYQSLRR